MIRWIALFVGIPLAELMLLIEIGQRIGTLYTIAIIVVTGILGATLARQQGLSVLRQLQEEVARKFGYRLVGHRLELYGTRIESGEAAAAAAGGERRRVKGSH